MLPVVSYIYVLILHFLYWDTYKIPSRFIPQWWREYDIRGGKLKNPDTPKHPEGISYSDLVDSLEEKIVSRVDSRGLYIRGKEATSLRDCVGRISLYLQWLALWLSREVFCLVILTPIMLCYVVGTISYTVNEVQFNKACQSVYNNMIKPIVEGQK
jgi:hypothetical protein